MKRKLIRLCAAAAAVLLAAGAFAETEVDMLAVDHRLYELGYRDGACNGELDEITISALRNFQIVNGLAPTGEADPTTVGLLLSVDAVSQWDYLNRLAQKNTAIASLVDGSYGDEVTRLQNALKELGYFAGSCDGAYGNETKAAVYRFQLANGLNESGVADSAVFMRLYEGEPIEWESFLAEGCATVGDTGHEVRRLQLWLKQRGYFSGECTGSYGEGTRKAVAAFQAANDLEQSGDLDMETCRRLYTDVNAFLRAGAEIRRGDTGADAEQLCRDLARLGYPAHARFNMQSELALMQFQLANKLDVTGVADDVTLVLLHSENATPRDGYTASRKLLPDNDALGQKIYRKASSLLGQYSEMDSCFDFLQYVALCCGVELMDFSQLNRVQIGEADTIEAGAFLGVQVGGKEILGIAASDRALIYRADSGYIVMSYMDRMGAEDICLYHVVEEV